MRNGGVLFCPNEIWAVLHLCDLTGSAPLFIRTFVCTLYLHFKESPGEPALHIYMRLATLNEYVKICKVFNTDFDGQT